MIIIFHLFKPDLPFSDQRKVSSYDTFVRSRKCHTADVAGIINNRTYRCPGRTCLSHDPDESTSCQHILIYFDAVITSLINRKCTKPVSGVLPDHTGSHFRIFCISLIQLVQILKTVQFVFFLLKITVFRGQLIHLLLKFFIFFFQLFQCLKIFTDISDPCADLTDAFLHGNHRDISHSPEGPFYLLCKHRKNHQ